MDKKNLVEEIEKSTLKRKSKGRLHPGEIAVEVINENGGVKVVRGNPINNNNGDENIPEITKNDVIDIIESLKRTSGYDNSSDYKKAISNGEVKFYSRARLNMWERYERMLEEKFKDEQ
jgi:phosphoribosyl-AMP cyclohydrolase